MRDLSEKISSVEEAGYELFWLGPASAVTVKALEDLIEFPLPQSFVDFLLTYGGGGVVGAEISGIEDDDALMDTGGTVWGDTIRCRERYDLPPKYAVIYFHHDEICWCIDATNPDVKGCPVVSYDVFRKVFDAVLNSDFSEFLEEYLDSYASL